MPCKGPIPCKLRLKCDGTPAETRFRLSAKRTSPFKSAGASVQSTTGSRGVRIGSSSAGSTMFRGSVKRTGYTLHSPVSPSLSLPCVTMRLHISIRLYKDYYWYWLRGLQLTLEVFLRWGKLTVPCLWPIANVFHFIVHQAEVQLCLVRLR
jgi:hypothetical protein